MTKSLLEKPVIRPSSPYFSSGPCAKRPGWSLALLQQADLGRSHRSAKLKAKLQKTIDLTREILQVPQDYRIAIVPASDTGAVEMALWSLLGERGIDILSWESFGQEWVRDVTTQLKLGDVRHFSADYGQIPDLWQIDFDRDVVFTWNGTTSGVRVPHGDFIAAGRTGLTICDATSAAFAQQLDFAKLDVVTFSWQKALGGEGAHGMLILSPRAVERLESYQPVWPLPKIFRLTKNGKLIEGIFKGETINTPSMLCVEDYLDALQWAKSIGGLPALVQRADDNLGVLREFVAKAPWLEFLAQSPDILSNTSPCLRIIDKDILRLDDKSQANFAKALVARLEVEQVAYDIGSYRDAPVGLRIWTGATVESADVRALCAWLDWAYHTEKPKFFS